MTYKKAALQLRKTPRISVEQPFLVLILLFLFRLIYNSNKQRLSILAVDYK